jgi:hypothetical protein
MRKRITLLMAALAMAVTMSLGTVAFAAPSFGPGSSGGGPHAGNAKCHPPGQTTTTPGCK